MATEATTSKHCTIELSEDAARKVAFVMTELHEVLKKVFKYLPMKTLNTCSRVCKRWRDVASREKGTRDQLLWLLFDKKDKHKDVVQQVGCYIENCRSLPHKGLLICSFNLQDCDLGIPVPPPAGASRHPRSAKRDRVRIIDYIQQQLPSGCDIFSIVTDGVIGTTTETCAIREMELSDSATCLLWPALEGLDVYGFYGNPNMDTVIKEATEGSPLGIPDPVKMSAFTGIPLDKRPRVVLLFYTEQPVYMNSELSSTFIKQYDGQLIVAGGHADGILTSSAGHVANNCNHHEDEKLLLGLAFCGENIKAASVVLDTTVNTPDAVAQSLKRLKDTHIPEQNTIGFMFACLGRGREFYNKKNVEADAFRELFPHVPLFGFFGNGELGYDYLPDYSTPGEAAEFSVIQEHIDNDLNLPQIHHAYTSIFVLVHLGFP